MRRRQHIDLKLHLIEELAVAISVLYNYERLLIVHFVFLDLLNLVLFVFVQDVPAKLVFILLQNLNVSHPVVERGGHELLEIGKMNEFRVDRLQHFFIEV